MTTNVASKDKNNTVVVKMPRYYPSIRMKLSVELIMLRLKESFLLRRGGESGIYKAREVSPLSLKGLLLTFIHHQSA